MLKLWGIEMYSCGDILYSKETGSLIMIIGYNAEEVNEILNANKYNSVKIDTIKKLDNTYVSYCVLPLLVLTSIKIDINMEELCSLIAKNLKSQVLKNYINIGNIHQEPMRHYDKVMHVNGMENYFIKNKMYGVLIPDYYTKKDLEKKFKQV